MAVRVENLIRRIVNRRSDPDTLRLGRQGLCCLDCQGWTAARIALATAGLMAEAWSSLQG